jgi:transposase-like protein
VYIGFNKGDKAMKVPVLSNSIFHNEARAYAFVEKKLWPDGPVCPHCGNKERNWKLKGKSFRIGSYKCRSCRKPFTVKIGTIFEDSHIPMRLWLQAIFTMAHSKKGVSSNQLHRTLGITLKSAWFMSHRIREAMRDGELYPFGVNGGIVEADETFLWNDETLEVPKDLAHLPVYFNLAGVPGTGPKKKVLSLVDRQEGNVRSVVVEDLKAKTIVPILRENIAKEARIFTDDARRYVSLKDHFEEHSVVNHSIGEYVSFTNPEIHTNTVEGYFSLFKRGMRGVYQHCAKKHLHRYLAEFDFRYSNRIAKGIDDSDRAGKLLKGVAGKRLTYQTTHSQIGI